MNKKIIIAIIFVLLIICCGIPAGLWLFAAANTKPTCSIVPATEGNKLIVEDLDLSISNRLDIRIALGSVKTMLMSKSTSLFGTNTDYKCPESLSELNINPLLVTNTGKEFDLLYKKTGDYTAIIGIRIDGKEYYE